MAMLIHCLESFLLPVQDTPSLITFPLLLDLKQTQLDNSSFSPVLQAKEQEVKPLEDILAGYSLATRRLFQMWDQLKVDGVLIHLFVVLKMTTLPVNK